MGKRKNGLCLGGGRITEMQNVYGSRKTCNDTHTNPAISEVRNSRRKSKITFRTVIKSTLAEPYKIPSNKWSM